MADLPADRDELANDLAMRLARARTRDVFMDGSHNPLPSEVLSAREFFDAILSSSWLVGVVEAAKREALTEAKAAMRSWVEYNSTDMGELGRYIRCVYVFNALEVLSAFSVGAVPQTTEGG